MCYKKSFRRPLVHGDYDVIYPPFPCFSKASHHFRILKKWRYMQFPLLLNNEKTAINFCFCYYVNNTIAYVFGVVIVAVELSAQHFQISENLILLYSPLWTSLERKALVMWLCYVKYFGPFYGKPITINVFQRKFLPNFNNLCKTPAGVQIKILWKEL